MEDDVPAPPSRRRLWFAVAVSLAAIPLLILDNRSDEPSDPTAQERSPVVATVVVPVVRAATGPPKGISVVTTSTTASTLPITTIVATSG